ncbi:MAG TPA: glycosyltransferase family 39 protein [Methylomirabilota bacterium]|nr:glycosyltransferase family 39 protein [Methylomirabilota bacterium]
MGSLLELDRSIFLLLNRGLANPILDWAMPFFAWNKLFIPALLLLAIWLIWKGGLKGRLFLLLLVLSVSVADGFLCDKIKDLVGRDRPFLSIPDARVLVGKGGSGSFPSSHAANWFAAASLVWIYYRRAFWIVFALGSLVGFSRIYVGVHYPLDVLGGVGVGVLSTFLVLGILQALWRSLGRKWFPLWWARLPSLLPPRGGLETVAELHLSGTDQNYERTRGRQWERLAYVLIGALSLLRWAYIGGGKIELSEDEAYQWLWSQHLAPSYYSKPPLIAYAQFLGTSLFGHNEFGVRFLSPLLAAILSACFVRWFSREISSRAGLLLFAALSASPMLAVGATLMTIDALSVFFWGMAMLAGWSALQRYSLWKWMLTGVCLGLGFLSKYVALFQVLSFALVFTVNPAWRAQLRRPGPWLALLILLLSFTPVLVWNAQHDWITMTHLAERGGLVKKWRFTLKYFIDFVGGELFLLNPVFAVLAIVSTVYYARRLRENPLPAYLVCMGAPVFIFYLLLSLRSRVQPNWIAPAVVPLLGLAALHLLRSWREAPRSARLQLTVALCIGIPVIVFLHDTNLINKVAGRPLPTKVDPLVRVRGWKATAQMLETERQVLQQEGREVFVIGGHYGITSLMTFYNPPAKAAHLKGSPFTYYLKSPIPLNQFYFWPTYESRRGQNAIFIRRATEAEPAPEALTSQFRSVTDLGLREIQYRGRPVRTVQLFACRELL